MSSNRLSTTATLELVQSFTDGVRTFAEREGKINYAQKLKDSNLRQDIAEQEVAIKKEATEQGKVAQAEAAQRIEHAEEIFEARKDRISKATMTVRNDLIQLIQDKEGHYRFGLQKQLMDAEKARKEGLEAASLRYDQATAGSREYGEKFGALEEKALGALAGFPSLRKKVAARLEKAGEASAETAPDLAGLSGLYQQAGKGIALFRKNPFVSMFQKVPVWMQVILVLVLGAAAQPLLAMAGIEIDWLKIGIGAGGLAAFILMMYGIGWGGATPFAKKISNLLAKARRIRAEFDSVARQDQEAEKARLDADFQRVKEEFDSGLKETDHVTSDRPYESPDEVDRRGEFLQEKRTKGLQRRIDAIQKSLQNRLAEIESDKAARIASLSGEGQIDPSSLAEDFDAQRQKLYKEWAADLLPRESLLGQEASALDEELSWLSQTPAEWSAPSQFREDLVYGNLHFSLEAAEISSPQNEKLALNGRGEFRVPLRLTFPEMGSILFETKNAGREQAIDALNYLVLALLSGSPPGRLSFSLFDPVGLGESFAGLMHLADYEEHLINSRIRTQSDQIERRLGELCDHMEKVIQMYLRNEYATISEYNEKAGTIAERYHFIVIADFPEQFTDEAARRLISIASAGARCGVFTLIHYDQRSELPPGFKIDDLRKNSVCIRSNLDGFFLKDSPVSGAKLELQQPPESEKLIEWIHRIGEANRDSNRIEVPFDCIAPAQEQFWSLDTAKELRVPIGRTGATKLQDLAIGRGTCQHALIAGKTGSGKSTLFHIMITNLALWCDPDQVEFYLIDFKKGVEFKCYADHKLPHARVIAIESDRDFGLSVLQRLDEELKERGEKFRAMGVQDVAGYKKAGGPDPVPRTLLLIDEFQEFFVEDDQISQQAAVLLDRIVRQGRAFGIHAILGSQTLGGAFTLARATLGQMVIRIALQCNEADAYLIMDDTNPAPRLLTRPGEGIYNDSAGAIEANSPFQVVWLEEEERDSYLAQISRIAQQRDLDKKQRVIFEGNAPANVADDSVVSQLLERGPGSGTPTLYLGAPNAIKGPTEVGFERQSGSNLMIVGQREDAVEAMTAVGLRLLRAQLGEKARLILIDGQVSDPNSQSWLKSAVAKLGFEIECPDSHEYGDKINEVAAEMREISEGNKPATDRSTFLFILGLQRYKKLRFEEDFSFSLDDDGGEKKPSDSLNDLICEGPSIGYHMILSLDTYNNVNRCISRKAISEFEKKILFQMSASDSASLIDSGKAGNLGMNRALYYNEPTGLLETFRPFAQPEDDWFEA